MMDPRKIGQFLMGQWDKTSQPLKERASLLPLGQYEDGSVGMAWPGFMAAPAEAGKRAYDSGMPLSTTDPDAAEAAYRDMAEVALGTMLGGSVASMSAGPRGAALMANGPKRSSVANREVLDFDGGTRITMKDNPSGGRTIDQVYTVPEARGKGQARSALQSVISEADQSGTPLSLTVAPGGVGVDPARLQQFYRTLGFEDRGGGMMSRSAGGKMVQPQGIRAYHGTNREIDYFRPSSDGNVGPGVYLTGSPDEASIYTRANLDSSLPSILPVDVRGRLAPVADYEAAYDAVRAQVGSAAEARRMAADALRSQGFDGVETSVGGVPNYTMYNPGTVYSATTGDLLYANAKSGAALPLAADQEQDPALLEYLKAIGLY
jgi:GNAT superfamily N-acetyltransferase